VDILAAVAPPTHQGRAFDLLSGTSTAAPHVAGLAAIFKAQHPDWSPMAIKSALMTTAYDTKNRDGSASTDLFAQGAGEVDPSRMLSPALIYDAGQQDWLGYLEGLGIATGTGVPVIAPSNYNQASIADGNIVDSTVINRRVTAVIPGLYRASISVPGFRATVSPSILNFTGSGQTQQFNVTLTRTSAPLNTYADGYLTWTGGNTKVRSPVAVRPIAVRSSQPAVQIIGTAGSVSWTVTSGITGAFPITANGMAAATDQPGEVTPTTRQQFTITVAAGTKLARFATHVPNDTTGADIDLVVARLDSAGNSAVVGQSGGPTANETIDLVNPVPGTYLAQVSGFAAATGTTSTAYTFRDFLIDGTAAAGHLTVDPAKPTTQAGQTITVTASVNDLNADQPYLGWVEYIDGTGTTVEANPDQ